MIKKGKKKAMAGIILKAKQILFRISRTKHLYIEVLDAMKLDDLAEKYKLTVLLAFVYLQVTL